MPNTTPSSRTSADNTRLNKSASSVKLAYLASSQQPSNNNSSNVKPSFTENSHNGNSIPNISTTTTPTFNRPLARERPFAREDNSNNSNSRPPSIRSATSFGRPINRFISGHHARHQSTYSNFSTMSETALPWTTQDIGFNAISGNNQFSLPLKFLLKPV